MWGEKNNPKPRVCPLADIAIKINKGGRGGNDAAEGGAALYLTETAQYNPEQRRAQKQCWGGDC